MRILPWGGMLPVHCCCGPALRWGWVPVPEPRLRSAGRVKFMIERPSYEMLTGEYSGPVWIEAEVAVLQSSRDGVPDSVNVRLAVKSNDIPIELWRKVPGWIEDQRNTE